MQVIVCLWEVRVGIIKLQNDSFVLFGFLEIRWQERVGCYLLCWRSVCLGFPWPLKWDILALCTWVVTIFLQQKNVFRPCCLVCDILYNHPVVLVSDIHWAFPQLTRNKNKNANSGISSSLFLDLRHVRGKLLGRFWDLATCELPWFIRTCTKPGVAEGQKISFRVVLSVSCHRFALNKQQELCSKIPLLISQWPEQKANLYHLNILQESNLCLLKYGFKTLSVNSAYNFDLGICQGDGCKRDWTAPMLTVNPFVFLI